MKEPMAITKPFTVRALAEHWECSEDLIYKLLRTRKLGCYKVGSETRISTRHVAEYEQANDQARNPKHKYVSKKRAKPSTSEAMDTAA